MTSLRLTGLFAVILFVLFSVTASAQNPVNWTPKQVLEPKDLAENIQSKKNLPLIISVGPGAVIPNSVDVGMVNNEAGLTKLKAELSKLPKDQKVVIYCGCCPFEHCPNVRPAIDALKSLSFTNYYVLDLSTNIKKDWIDKGYPVIKQ